MVRQQGRIHAERRRFLCVDIDKLFIVYLGHQQPNGENSMHTNKEPTLLIVVAYIVTFGLLCTGLVGLGLAYFDCLIK